MESEKCLKWIDGIMKIEINLRNRKIKNFKKTWINTLHSLGLLSGDPLRDSGVIGEIYESSRIIYLDAPDLPSEALGVLKEYFGNQNISVYENT